MEEPRRKRQRVDGSSSEKRNTLFIRSLPSNTTSEKLSEHFSESYPIKHAVAVTDTATKTCKGYGFVTFADAEDAQRAKEEFNGSNFGGRTIKVEIAEPRHRDAEDGPVRAKKEHKSEEKKQEFTQPQTKLIVRNLPWSIKEPDQLAKLFLSYGKIKLVQVPKKRTGEMAGFGIIILRGRKNAEKALQGVNGKVVDGRTLAVDWAVDRETWSELQKAEKNQESEVNNRDRAVKLPGKSPNDETAENSDEAEADEDDDDDDEGSDDHDIDTDEELDEDEDDLTNPDTPKRLTDNANTLFVRNVPFTCTDEDLQEHFQQFGGVRYARIVFDPTTERSRGTGFVCFYKLTDAEKCLRNSPKPSQNPNQSAGKDIAPLSVLQDEYADPSGEYTIDGRILQISRAVDRNEASRLKDEGLAKHRSRDVDKRRLYLLSEGTIPHNSPLYERLPPSEKAMREASEKQRKALIEGNPSLHLSFTRLSIRNIPRSVTSKDLKALAREAVVGFATDVKAGKRQKLAKEELLRGGEDMLKAEKERKKGSRGIVKQAKVVFEGREGSKVEEASGAGRSRGYGFIEYHTHRTALMGLRWLNGHVVDYQVKEKKAKMTKDEIQDRKKRLIVEFAIENAQVVHRRKEKEERLKGSPGGDLKQGEADGVEKMNKEIGSQSDAASKQPKGMNKRKRTTEEKPEEDTKEIIGRKMMLRRKKQKRAGGKT
ncbi:RNA-binding domain-containing protein [Aulographum hederae CBS 113979]|uniref:RNA-binding domain-containing protein n=1 Tax=Aulographum hederae CBS 113979 TaxID=1176131 RepID=A0A6G1HD02_9PEZI|nr:RNA-binding domain-containing protein [Aulographum hederae CBS 113979]